MNKQTFGIGILSLTALVLLIANYFATPPALGIVTFKDRDYQACTARMQGGGEALFVLDNRTGMLTVFTYDQSTRRVVARAGRPVGDLFGPPALGR